MEAFDMAFGSFLRKYPILFKDENSEYFLFNISSVVCITQRRTNFGFKKAEDKMTVLKAGNVPVMREKDRKMIALTCRMRDASSMRCIMW